MVPCLNVGFPDHNGGGEDFLGSVFVTEHHSIADGTDRRHRI